MKASEAKKIAYDKNTAESDSQYAINMKKIEEMARKGEYSITVPSIKADVKAKLIEEGYEVKDYSDYREGSYCTISWK